MIGGIALVLPDLLFAVAGVDEHIAEISVLRFAAKLRFALHAFTAAVRVTVAFHAALVDTSASVVRGIRILTTAGVAACLDRFRFRGEAAAKNPALGQGSVVTLVIAAVSSCCCVFFVHAVCVATIAIVHVPVIALLSRVKHAIAAGASLILAGRTATVSVRLVAVVALLSIVEGAVSACRTALRPVIGKRVRSRFVRRRL